MTKIDVISGFLGAGKTTLIKKLLKEALGNTKVVLIENEFGEIGIDGGFLKEAGIEIKEMNSGCICCSLVGDFGEALKEVLETYQPERVLIEPSGVGKLSDVLAAIETIAQDIDVEISSAIAVVDAAKCKMYSKNFGEFFQNQVQYAGTILLSRIDRVTQEKLQEAAAFLHSLNPKAMIVTTPWDFLDGKAILDTMEGEGKLQDWIHEILKESEHIHPDYHHDHDDEEDIEQDHGPEQDDKHEHEHEHENDHEHEHDQDHDHEHEHEHEHEHDYEHECDHAHDHEHEHEHDHEGEHAHDHEHDHDHDHAHAHHHADEIFDAWGMETPAIYTSIEIQHILEALDTGKYGNILRAKGIIPSSTKDWIDFDYVPQEYEIREGSVQITGKICVIGENLKPSLLDQLFATKGMMN
ncbi:MAG: GTP-binding protein [Clostridium sp.]|jgi:G3E family GTPase|nr:GTP-binding protein [Clostridium sp.]